jgi:hypothetical protein
MARMTPMASRTIPSMRGPLMRMLLGCACNCSEKPYARPVVIEIGIAPAIQDQAAHTLTD